MARVTPCHCARALTHLSQEGKVEVFDLGAASRVHVEDAHEGPVWSLAALPDRTGFVSGSADKTVKFWQWKVVVTGEGVKQLRWGGQQGSKGPGEGSRTALALSVAALTRLSSSGSARWW